MTLGDREATGQRDLSARDLISAALREAQQHDKLSQVMPGLKDVLALPAPAGAASSRPLRATPEAPKARGGVFQPGRCRLWTSQVPPSTLKGALSAASAPTFHLEGALSGLKCRPPPWKVPSQPPQGPPSTLEGAS